MKLASIYTICQPKTCLGKNLQKVAQIIIRSCLVMNLDMGKLCHLSNGRQKFESLKLGQLVQKPNYRTSRFSKN